MSKGQRAIMSAKNATKMAWILLLLGQHFEPVNLERAYVHKGFTLESVFTFETEKYSTKCLDLWGCHLNSEIFKKKKLFMNR